MPFGPGMSIKPTLVVKIRFKTYSCDLRIARYTDFVFGIVGKVFAWVEEGDAFEIEAIDKTYVKCIYLHE